MEAEISLTVMSPEQVMEECEVSYVKLPGRKGAFEVLPGHAPLITSLEKGTVEYKTSAGEQKTIPVKSGFVEIKGGKVSVCVEL